MADHHNAEAPLGSSEESQKLANGAPKKSPPSYSAWRTAAHLYLPFVTVTLFMTFGTPFGSTPVNVLCVVLSAIPTNWLASFFYPADRPEPTPEEAIRFSRKWDVYRAAILFTYRWLFGTPFNAYFFAIDLAMTYVFGSIIGERPADAKQRRSEFGVHLLWGIASTALVFLSPSFLSFWVNLADRVIWRVTYIALVDDIVGVLARPNLKTWKGKVRLVLIQAFVIFFMCWMVLSWRRDKILASRDGDAASWAAIQAQQDPFEAEGFLEDDGDRFLSEL